MKKCVLWGSLVILAFFLGVIFSDPVIAGINHILGSHIMTKEQYAIELRDSRQLLENCQRRYKKLVRSQPPAKAESPPDSYK